MNLPLLALSFLVLLVVAYRLYGKWVGRQFALDDAHATPAHRKSDGIDYVPTPRFYLFAQHFSAIAAAGPIAGGKPSAANSAVECDPHTVEVTGSNPVPRIDLRRPRRLREAGGGVCFTPISTRASLLVTEWADLTE